tara:strand:+ start:36 stop:587 length:552 start_codon:yes stop_codon:yes gene_type:complete
MNCIKCTELIPNARIKALPGTKECVRCSSIERNYVRTIISGKTTYSEIEVIKNKDTKEYLKGLDSKGRQGFGSMLYRASKNDPSPKASSLSLKTRVTRKMPEYSQASFEKVLGDAMNFLDHDKNYAIEKIDKALSEEIISGSQRRQAIEILDTFKPDPVQKIKINKLDPVDDEILHVFKNWRI